MPSKPSVYLAGPIQHAADNGHGWRDFVTDEVDAFEWLNPLDHAEPTEAEYEAGEYDIADLVLTDKRLIDQADAVLVGWRRVPSVGTPMEILYAFERNVPVVVWFEPGGSTHALDERLLSPWLRYHADHVDVALRHCIDALTEAIDSTASGPTDAPLFDRRDRQTFQEAVEAWGIDAQAEMAEEECAELIVASKHWARGKVDEAAFVDELADVRIMGEQLTEFIGRETVEDRVQRKMARLRERLADEGVTV